MPAETNPSALKYTLYLAGWTKYLWKKKKKKRSVCSQRASWWNWTFVSILLEIWNCIIFFLDKHCSKHTPDFAQTVISKWVSRNSKDKYFFVFILVTLSHQDIESSGDFLSSASSDI